MEFRGMLTFNTIKMTVVSKGVEDAVRDGIAAVWGKHIGEPKEFQVIHARRILAQRTSEPTSDSATYDPDRDVIILAHDTIREKIIIGGLEGEEIAFIIAAHEAMHVVQFRRGDRPEPSPKDVDSNVESASLYYNNRHEMEAWRESLDAFKKR